MPKCAVFPEVTVRLACDAVNKWRAFWMELYAENRLHFTIATILVVLFVGALLGILTDSLMKRLGIDLNSRKAGEE